MRTLKRVAAILCSATVLTGVGMAAFVANAQDTVPLTDRQAELDSDVVNIIADQVYAVPGEKVEYNVSLTNNAATGGYSGSGLVLVYDERLTPAIQAGTEDIPDAKAGVAAQGLLPFYSLNPSIYTFAAGTAGSMNAMNDNDGIYVTTWFTVPPDAKDGDLFPITLQVDRWVDTKNTPISYYQVSGWIKVRTNGTTTTTESTTTTTVTTTNSTSTTESTTTTTETSSTTTTSSTTESTTTTTTDTTTGSTTTTTDTGSTSTTTDTKTTITDTDTDTTSSTTTTSTDKTTKVVTKSTAPDDAIASTTKPQGVSTGDSGIGFAVAALALAAGAAIVTGSKRKEH